MKGFLITPDALVPFKGAMKDDFGLTRMDWIYDYEQVQFSLFRTGDPNKEKADLKKRIEAYRHAQLFAIGLHGLPLVPPQGVTTPVGWLAAAALLQRDLEAGAKEDAKRDIIKGVPVPMANFQAKLEQFDKNHALNPGVFLEMLKKQDLPKNFLPKEYQLAEEDSFDVQRVLSAQLKPKGEDVQKHFRLRLWMQATDNNVETGPGVTLAKEPITFLVIFTRRAAGGSFSCRKTKSAPSWKRSATSSKRKCASPSATRWRSSSSRTRI